MPFDVLIDKPVSLNDHLALLGITPVPVETLDRHKVEQERLHPAHWLSTPWPMMGMAILFAVIAGCYIFPIQPYAVAVALVTVISVMMTCLLWGIISAYVIIRQIKIHGKAKWHEVQAYNDWLIPSPIREVVRQVRHTMPGTLYIGELRQDEVVLDPYIILVHGGERACLGIWLDETVIACADID